MNRKTIVSTATMMYLALGLGLFPLQGNSVLAETKLDNKTEKVFHAVAIDSKGVETDIKNVIFYWEEKISETAFVPHEMREVPVKRGTATVKIKFDGIKNIDLKPSGNGVPPHVTITLHDGKTGEFMLAIAGSFKGQSDFGEVELPAGELKKLAFK